MSKLLKMLLGSALPMYVGEQGGGGVADDHDLDDDLDEDQPSEKEGSEEVAVGDQPDGSVVLEVEDKADANDDTNADETDEAREQLREARRKERQERKERAREREATTKRELAAERDARKKLEERLALIEGKDKSRELAQIDEGIKRVQNQYNFQKERLQQAHEQHDGAAAADATEKMLAARDSFTQLKNVKDGYERSLKAPPTLDSRLVSHAQAFVNEHNWYKPGSSDQDTKIVKVIDDSLAEEGWDPATTEYWDELRARIKKVLPHRVAGGKVPTTDAPSTPRKQKSVVAGGNDTQAPGTKGTFTLSAARVSALKEAGMWSDPKQRADAIERFRKYDKENKG